jgi:hypothetical protein
VSPLIDRQRRATELGRIRIGTTILRETRNGGTRAMPAKLDTFRFTSRDRAKIEAVAALYGGSVGPWDGARTGPQWEVITEAKELPVAWPPGEPLSQHYELWTGRGCERRCDGEREQFTGKPCMCPPDLGMRKELAGQDPPAACKPRTRLSLILADIPGLGVWVLTSTGDAAADELAGVAELLHTAALGGVILPAVLRLEQRESRSRGETKRYAVPVLDVRESFAALAAGPHGSLTLGAGVARPELTAAPVTEDDDAQRIADDAMRQDATADGVRELWQEAATGKHLERPVTVGDQTGQLGDLLTIRLSTLTSAAAG